MTPFYFGPPERRLFAILQRHEGSGRGRGGVVLAAPFGHEAIRVHRFYRVLAGRLARLGFDSLRFDYYGTGDSAGDDADVLLAGWSADIESADCELVARTGSPVVCWLGARLGATAALQALEARALRAPPTEWPRLALWDPVVDGATYLRELRLRHVEALEASFSLRDSSWRWQLHDPAQAPLDEAIGFAVPAVLRAELEALRPTLGVPAAARLALVCSPRAAACIAWADSLSPPAPVRRLDHDFEWTSDDSLSTALVPGDALAQLLKTIDDGSAAH